MDDFIKKKGQLQQDPLPIKKLNIHEKKEKIKQLQIQQQKNKKAFQPQPKSSQNTEKKRPSTRQ